MASPAVPITVMMDVIGTPSTDSTITARMAYSAARTSECRKLTAVRSALLFVRERFSAFITSRMTTTPMTNTTAANPSDGSSPLT